MDTKHFIRTYDGLIPPKFIGGCIKYLSKAFDEGRSESGTIGLKEAGKGTLNKEIRDVDIIALNNCNDSMSNCHWFALMNSFLVKAMSKYVDEFKDVYYAQVFDMQALKYQKNQHYKYHVDDGHGFNRKFSCIILLNNDYEGGELCFKTLDDPEIKIDVVPGRIIIWPSNFMYPHKINPVKKGTRYSIVSWLQ